MARAYSGAIFLTAVTPTAAAELYVGWLIHALVHSRIKLALALFLGVVLGYAGGRVLDDDAQAELLAAAAPGALALEHYRATHGRYPDSLSAAGTALPAHTSLPFRYRALQGGQDYELVAGEYDRDGMVVGFTARGVFVDR